MSPQVRTATPLPEDVSGLVKAVTASSAGDALKIATALIELQAQVYNTISRQGNVLLGWALAVALAGAVFLGVAPFVLLPWGGADTAGAILTCGGVIEALAALLLLFFGINLLRLAACQHQLSRLQRFMLANNLTQALPETERAQSYAELTSRLSGGATLVDVLGEVTDALDHMVARSRHPAPGRPAAAYRPAGTPEEIDTIRHLTP
jgi:hypothetical protein